ncbi:MAG: hypothetical protein HON90_00080 [Halobacteriovoraceae bacterium]|jgi:hypothetical protein|nr:hypothetical protein [Halobacteriovoraceae bacterium]
MIYYIFRDQIFTVFLSMTHLSAVTFPSKIYDYVGGERGDFKIYELNKGKSLVYEVKRKGIDKNFIVFQKGGKYHFNLKYDESMSNKDIEIKQARRCELFSLLKKEKDYKLFECPRSLLVVNTSVKNLNVNGFVVKKSKYISKGPPVWIDQKLVYLKGQLL